MATDAAAGGNPARALAAVVLALAGLLFSFTPWSERIDAALLDAQWSLLRRFDPRPAPDDIIVVGVDEATLRSIPEPPALWHAVIGEVLVRIASAHPRAIGLDLPLPDRSYEQVRAGLDKALLVGLAAARERAPVVASLSIDAGTRAARPVHAPYLAVLGEHGLGLSLFARDVDGAVRRFSLAIPTEDGAYPTVPGRLCKVLARRCGDGLVHFALGNPIPYVPMRRVLDLRDETALGKLFRDRIVLVGTVLPFTDRVPVPVNYAGWERTRTDSPGVVLHAQSLRTALLDAAPRETSRVPLLLLVTAAALLAFMREARMAAVLAILAVAGTFAISTLALRAGWLLPTAPVGLTVVLSLGFVAWRQRALARRNNG